MRRIPGITSFLSTYNVISVQILQISPNPDTLIQVPNTHFNRFKKNEMSA